jgi:hypothetical protein
MRSQSRLLARLEVLEAKLKPPVRQLVFLDYAADPASYDERLAAFRADMGRDSRDGRDRLLRPSGHPQCLTYRASAPAWRGTAR